MAKSLTAKELRLKTAKELEAILKEQKNILLKLKVEKKLGKLKQTHLLRETKKAIARILTVINSKKNEASS